MEAANSNCTLVKDCMCSAAETKVNCSCPAVDIDYEFQRLEQKLSVSRSWKLTRRHNDLVTATVPHMVSANLVIVFQKTIDTTALLVRNDSCYVKKYHITRMLPLRKGSARKNLL